MLTLILDQGLSSERSLPLMNFQERPIDNLFTGSYNITVIKDTELPHIENFVQNGWFETVKAFNSDGIEIPIVGHYNHILDFNCIYDDQSKRFSMTLMLNWEVLENDQKP